MAHLYKKARCAPVQDDSDICAKRCNSAGAPQARGVNGALGRQRILITVKPELEHQRQDILCVPKTKHGAWPFSMLCGLNRFGHFPHKFDGHIPVDFLETYPVIMCSIAAD